MDEIGVIHGRFQVLHNDHLVYLRAGKARCRHLIVGLTNPDPEMTRAEPSDPHRAAPDRNPLTYFERHQLVRRALSDTGIAPEELSIVPFPISRPALLRHYVPDKAVCYLTIYDAWGREKLARLQSLGLRTVVLWERRPQEKGLSSSEVRRRMVAGEPWESLVPPGVAELLRIWEIPARLRALADHA